MKGRKLLSAVIAGAMVLGTMSFPAFADGGTSMSFDEFVSKIEAGESVGTDSERLTIEWSPVSGCRDNRGASGHTCIAENSPATASTPMRVNSSLAQFHVANANTNNDVVIKNVDFKYTAADFSTCLNSAWKGSFTQEQAPTAQIYLLNNGNVTVSGCTFDNAVLTMRADNVTDTENRKVSVKDCTFKNISNSYGLKDVQAGNVVIAGNTFENTRSGIMLSGATAKNVLIDNNTFSCDDSLGGDLIQIASNFAFDSDSSVAIVNNTSTSDTPVLRALNDAMTNLIYANNTIPATAPLLKDDASDAMKDAINDKLVAPVAQIGDTKYSTLADALAAAQDGDTIDLLDNTIALDGQTTIDKDITITNGTFDITDAVCTTEGIIYIYDSSVKFNNVDLTGSDFTSAFGVIFANHNANVILDNCDFRLKNDLAPLGGTLKGNDNASFTVKNCKFDLENPSRVLTDITLDMSNTTINAYVTDPARAAGDLNNHAFRNVYGEIKDSTIDVTGTETGLKNTGSGSLSITGTSNVSFTNTVYANIYLNDENEILTVEPSANVIGDIVYKTVSESVLTDKITVNFVPTADENVYDIVLDGNYKEIYEFVSAEIQFINAGNGYQIDGTDDINVDANTDHPDRYGFYLKDGTLGNRITATKIKIGQVTFPAYGTINFKVDANNSKVVVTNYNTNLEKYYTAADENAKLTADENGINSTIAAPSIPVGSGGTGAVSFIVDFRTNGGSIVSSVKVKKGEKVIRPEDPTKEGYTFGGWFTDEALKKEYDFDTKVQKKLVLYAKWIEEAAVEPEPELPVFTDVKETDWFYESVMTAFKKGLMNGVSETEFAPDTTLTRAMLVTILYRAEGEPATNRSIPFADIEMGSYYANAVIWAAQNGIVNGTTETTFAPDSNITREQVAAILYRYAIYKGMDAVDLSENLNFADSDDVSEYAISALNWATGCGLVTGYEDNTLRPLANTTRAEAATLLQRFIETDK